MTKDTSDEDGNEEDTSDEYASEEGASDNNTNEENVYEDLSVADTSKEDKEIKNKNEKNKKGTNLKTCPICKSKKKNILLHINKSQTCKANISAENMKMFKDQSKSERKKKNRLSKRESTKRAKDKYWIIRGSRKMPFKLEQRERKRRSRDKASKEKLKTEKEINNFYKVISRFDAKEKEIEEGKQIDWKVEDGTCPSCKQKKKNVLLHLRKSKLCQEFITNEQMVDLNVEAYERKLSRKKRAYRNFAEKRDDQNFDNGIAKLYEMIEKREQKKNETLKEKQNRWKAKSRAKAQQREDYDYDAAKRYQKENTRKCRENKILKVHKANKFKQYNGDKDCKDDIEEIREIKDVSFDKQSQQDSFNIPERCPICKAKKNNLLLHIKNKKSCYEKINKQKFEEWSKAARYETKRKYMIKFDESGGHNKARKRKRAEMKALRIIEMEKENQKSVVRSKYNRFIKFSAESLMYLSIGETPTLHRCGWNSWLIQTDYSIIKDPESRYTLKSMLNEEESHAWVKKINVMLLESLISLQNVILIPSATWMNAVKAVEDSSKEETENKLLMLIGNLQANRNENTKEIVISNQFKSTCKQSEATRWTQRGEYNKWGGYNRLFTKDDEILLIGYIENILGKGLNLIDEEIQELLGIKEVMENLYVALGFAAH